MHEFGLSEGVLAAVRQRASGRSIDDLPAPAG